MKLMDYRQGLKLQVEDEERQKKEAYLRSCDENERKMVERQENYKKQFYDYDQSLSRRQEMYAKQVMSPHEEKLRKQIDWEQNGGHAYLRMVAERQA